MPGKQTKCTPELTRTVAAHIETGLCNKDAFALAGLPEVTAYRWLTRANNELHRIANTRQSPRSREQPFVDFAHALATAAIQRKQRLLSHVQRAATGGAPYTEIRETFTPGADDENPKLTERLVITRHTPPDWKASTWLLQHLHPDEFGAKLTLDWRQEATNAGLDPDQLFSELVDRFAALLPGDEPTRPAGAPDGPPTDQDQPPEPQAGDLPL